MNQQDVLHHIVSPSSHLYIDGDHNESVFNSCPVHNQLHPNSGFIYKMGSRGFGIDRNCHIGNEAYLYSDETIKMLLNKVASSLLYEIYYVPNAVDIAFVSRYKTLYESDILVKVIGESSAHQ